MLNIKQEGSPFFKVFGTNKQPPNLKADALPLIIATIFGRVNEDVCHIQYFVYLYEEGRTN